MKRVLIALSLLGITASTLAVEAPSAQWKASPLSLFELVQTGYNIVAVTDDGSSRQMFYVQKSGSAYKCIEIHIGDFNSKNYTASFRCWELVKPYVAALPQ
jgi:hypothetical protein